MDALPASLSPSQQLVVPVARFHLFPSSFSFTAWQHCSSYTKEHLPTLGLALARTTLASP